MVESDKKKLAEEIALFRYGMIADLARRPPGAKGVYAELTQRAGQSYVIPGSSRTRVAAETIRDWLKRYRKGGFDALVPGIRKDAGAARALTDELMSRLIEVKEDKPDLTVQQVIDQVAKEMRISQETLRYSTVHRFLAGHGLTIRHAEGQGSSKDHRRFAFKKAGDFWMSDVMHGPVVSVPGKGRRKAYLIAFLDDATRVIPHAFFTLSENTTAFLPVLKTAVMRRGIPKRLFVDNGSAYRSHQLALVCAKLGISLIHARPYHPQAKGKQERWFRTVRTQLLPLLTPEDTSSIEALNRRLAAYIEGEYHQSPHRGLDGDTPLDRWSQTADEVVYPDSHLDLDDLFLFEAKRKVHKDRTVSLEGIIYEVDAALVGESVILRYDPSKPGRPIQVWSGGKKVQEARVVDTYANCFVKRDGPSKSIVVESKEPDRQIPEPPHNLIRFSAVDDDDDEGEA